jgi:hypothetical protein
MKYYCQVSSSAVSSLNARLPPEEHANGLLLDVLYVCDFWRGEAEHLEFHT